ncbi:DUF3046 domain-containing protein [Corynebacterium sp. S7]
MRLTEFHQLIEDEFGDAHGEWIVHSHVIAELGDTPEALIESGVDPKVIWEKLCDDFEIPESRRFGVDRPGK